jgi:hypothetical protein
VIEPACATPLAGIEPGEVAEKPEPVADMSVPLIT